MRRALAIDERSYGPKHPKVATALNNLAQLLQANNRLVEAEPLMRRALLILLKFTHATSHTHPELRKFIENYRYFLGEMKLTKAQIIERINTLGPEAGFGEEDYRRLLLSLQTPP
jgi:hypothetical protein